MRSLLFAFLAPITLIAVALATGFAADSESADSLEARVWPTLGEPAKHFVSGCELWLFGEFVEPRVYPEYGDEKGYLVEKTDTEVLVNGIQYFSLLWKEPSAPPSEKAKRRAAIYSAVIRQLRARVEPRENGVLFDGKLYEFGSTILFEAEGVELSEPVPVTLDERTFHIDREIGGIIGPYVEPPPPSQAELDRIDAIRLDKAYSSLSGSLDPGWLVLAGRGYIKSYPLRQKDALMEALSKLPDMAEVRSVNRSGKPYYWHVTIDGFDFFSPVIADFVHAKRGGRQ